MTRGHVLPASLVYMDEWKAYDGLSVKGCEHKSDFHAEKVYVIGSLHTNT